MQVCQGAVIGLTGTNRTEPSLMSLVTPVFLVNLFYGGYFWFKKGVFLQPFFPFDRFIFAGLCL